MVSAIAVVIILIVIGAWVAGTYNALVAANTGIDGAWGEVEVQYQRRVDLIPNLINVMQVHMKYEAALLQNVTALRTQWAQAKTVDEKVGVATALDAGLGRLIAVAENYPELTASQSFIGLKDELAGTENRIAVARGRYNAIITSYNTMTLQFPSNVIAGMFGFKARPFYQAAAGAGEVVRVPTNVPI